MIDTSPTTTSGLISRDAVPPNRGYNLTWNSSDIAAFAMSGTGAATTVATSAISTLAVWHFIAGRFIPSTEVAIFVDGDKSTNSTAVPASCNVSTQSFEVGRYLNDGNRIIHAKCRDVFIFQSALTDDLITRIRQNTLPGE